MVFDHLSRLEIYDVTNKEKSIILEEFRDEKTFVVIEKTMVW